MSAAEIEQIKATLDATERDEIAKYGLDWEQVAWRRDTIKSVCTGDILIFEQQSRKSVNNATGKPIRKR